MKGEAQTAVRVACCGPGRKVSAGEDSRRWGQTNLNSKCGEEDRRARGNFLEFEKNKLIFYLQHLERMRMVNTGCVRNDTD